MENVESALEASSSLAEQSQSKPEAGQCPQFDDVVREFLLWDLDEESDYKGDADGVTLRLSHMSFEGYRRAMRLLRQYLEANKPTPPQNQPDPDEWVEITDPHHVLRSCDFFQIKDQSWHRITSSIGKKVGYCRYFAEAFRCRRRDLPSFTAEVDSSPAEVKNENPRPKYYIHKDNLYIWCIKRLPDGTRFDIENKSGQITIDRRMWSESCDRAVSIHGNWMECTIHQAAERVGKDAGWLRNVGVSMPDDFGSRLNLTREWLLKAAEKENGCPVSVGRIPPRPPETAGHWPPTEFISIPRVDLLNHLLKCIRDQFAEPDSWELGEIIMKEVRREGSKFTHLDDWEIQMLKLNSFPAGGKWGCCDGKGYLTYELSFTEGKWTCFLHRERATWMENILNGVKVKG